MKPWMRLGCPRNSVETRSITPGVSIAWLLNWRVSNAADTHVLHDIQKPIVHIGMVRELHLDLVEVRERISYIQRRLHKSPDVRNVPWSRTLRVPHKVRMLTPTLHAAWLVANEPEVMRLRRKARARDASTRTPSGTHALSTAHAPRRAQRRASRALQVGRA